MKNREYMELRMKNRIEFRKWGCLLLSFGFLSGYLDARPDPGGEKTDHLELRETVWLSEAGGPSCRLYFSLDFFQDEAGEGLRLQPSFSMMNDSVVKAVFGMDFLGYSFPMAAALFRDALAETYRKEMGQLYVDMPQAASLNHEYRLEGEVIDTGTYFWTYRLTDMRFTGGAHPMTVVRYMNFGGEGELGLEDVFGKEAETNLRPILFSALLRQEGVRTAEQLARKSYFPEQFFVSRNFYFKDSKVHFVYNAYDIAPYSRGVVEIAVPVERLQAEGLLK